MVDKYELLKEYTSGELTITLTEEKYNELLNQHEIKQSREEYEFIKNALEKQIPKKPKHIYRFTFRPVWADCCECGHVIPVNSKYCPYCGQKLDWSEEDE